MRERVAIVGTGVAGLGCAWQLRDGDLSQTRWEDRTAELDTGILWLNDLARRPAFVNPGSVGFAHDVACRAAYMLVDWDDNRVGLTLRRIPYAVDAVLQEMRDVGIPKAIRDKLCRQPAHTNGVATPPMW